MISNVDEAVITDRRYKLCEEFPALLSPKAEMNFPQGWYGLVRTMLSRMQNDVTHNGAKPIAIVEIREKFGRMRIYSQTFPDSRFGGMIAMAEAASGMICQNTGEAGAFRNINGWCVTLSDAEYEKVLKESR